MKPLILALGALLAAQWPQYKRADVPRLPDGKVNLTAPAPKFFDGHPDLSGVWENPGWREGAAAAAAVGVITGVGGVRQIFTDGRALPAGDPQPWWFGYSTGRWEGDTLVVQTGGFRDGGWLDVNGSPLTDAGKMTEKFRRINYGTLELELTVDDAKAYTKPFTVKYNQRLMPDDGLMEFVCQENERSSKHFK